MEDHAMKSIQKKLAAAVLLSLALPMSAYATATLQNSSILAGVSDYGTLGSNGNTPPGILFDKTGTSNYGVNDFLTPGTPFEGFYVTSANGNYSNNNSGGSSFGTFALTQNSAISVTATGMSSDGVLGVVNDYSLATIGGRSVISITSTLTNKGTTALTDLAFLRTLDPDPDLNAFGSYFTTNVVLSNDQSCGTGGSSGQTISIFTAATYAHKAGVSSYWSTDPALYLAGVNDGNGDYAIGIGFSLGSLAAGDSLSLTYGYALGESRDVATGGTVPEPMSALLVATGLLGIARSVRSKRNKA